MEVFFLTDNRQLKDFFAEKIVLKTIPPTTERFFVEKPNRQLTTIPQRRSFKRGRED